MNFSFIIEKKVFSYQYPLIGLQACHQDEKSI